jgi:hypothetical protein
MCSWPYYRHGRAWVNFAPEAHGAAASIRGIIVMAGLYSLSAHPQNNQPEVSENVSVLLMTGIFFAKPILP